MEDAIATLARKHETTRFVKIGYQDAEMDPVAAPAVLAYKGAELIANLVSVVDEVPEGRDVSAGSLEMLLME